ncbi:unnamed protein product, partial [Polarella glacialis]
ELSPRVAWPIFAQVTVVWMSVVQVVGSDGAFAAVKLDGSVITWGHSRSGGDSSHVEHRLQEGLEQVVCNGGSFAAVKFDGSVITWGDSRSGGTLHIDSKKA